MRTFKDHVTSNILDSQVTNNSRCFRIPPSKSEPYRHSFFERTIIDWNHLEDDSGRTVEWSVPETLSEQSVLLVAGLPLSPLSLPLSHPLR